MLSRRRFLVRTGLLGLGSACARQSPVAGGGVVVNDIHSRLNETSVATVTQPTTVVGLVHAISEARTSGKAVSIAGGRHAMGGQQFGAGAVLLDMRQMNRVIGFDAQTGILEVEAGIQWPELIEYLIHTQRGRDRQWGILQKQTGADRLSIGGALAANVHGRGLGLKPFIADVESFVLVDANGTTHTCSRQQNHELFGLAIGGYGLFGAIASVRLRLAPRRVLERVVQVMNVDDLVPAVERRIGEGYLFGDFQYATDHTSADFLRKGVFSCYRPVQGRRPPEVQKELSVADWRRLLLLSHLDKKKAFESYSAYYLSTSGQLYWSDTHQLSVYLDDYHRWLDQQLGSDVPATEMITEIYAPRPALLRLLEDARRGLGDARADVIYGTIRFIERDDESFLPWARDRYACVIFNIHVVHTPAGLERAARAFRGLIDAAIAHGGSYFLTYHRWANRLQVQACYPQFADFLKRKRTYDPAERFQSEWYRHYRAMFA
jgi:FAD/FMN-containing dehydrogenase